MADGKVSQLVVHCFHTSVTIFVDTKISLGPSFVLDPSRGQLICPNPPKHGVHLGVFVKWVQRFQAREHGKVVVCNWPFDISISHAHILSSSFCRNNS